MAWGERDRGPNRAEVPRRIPQHLVLFLQAKIVREQISQMVGPKAVFEASVIGTGIDKARQA